VSADNALKNMLYHNDAQRGNHKGRLRLVKFKCGEREAIIARNM